MRRTDREITDIHEILNVIGRTKILHLGLLDNEYPYVVPLHYGYVHEDHCLTFYMHSAKEGHKLDLIRNHPNVCIELECDVETIFGGDVPCRYGSAFSSVIGRGKAEIIKEKQEKIKGLKLLMHHQTGKIFDIDEKMAASVEMIKVKIEDVTAKSHPMG